MYLVLIHSFGIFNIDYATDFSSHATRAMNLQTSIMMMVKTMAIMKHVGSMMMLVMIVFTHFLVVLVCRSILVLLLLLTALVLPWVLTSDKKNGF